MIPEWSSIPCFLQLKSEFGNTHVAEKGITSFFFAAAQCSPVCLCDTFFIHSSVHRHLAGFLVLPMVNTAAVNTAVHVSFWITVFRWPLKQHHMISVSWVSGLPACPVDLGLGLFQNLREMIEGDIFGDIDTDTDTDPLLFVFIRRTLTDTDPMATPWSPPTSPQTAFTPILEKFALAVECLCVLNRPLTTAGGSEGGTAHRPPEYHLLVLKSS